jgi:predicted SAM-dependent methyltransferase
MRVNIGAGDKHWDGWISTQQAELDLLESATFARFFGDAWAEAFLCEHVWEHLTMEQGRAAARLVFAYLQPDGFLRVAVPDGHHPDPAYQALVAVNGPGPAADHQIVYTLDTFAPNFEAAGFRVRPLEWWDAAGQFHRADWNPDDAPIGRCSHLDDRNAAWRAGTGKLGFTSLILDCFRP